MLQLHLQVPDRLLLLVEAQFHVLNCILQLLYLCTYKNRSEIYVSPFAFQMFHYCIRPIIYLCQLNVAQFQLLFVFWLAADRLNINIVTKTKRNAQH